MQFMQSKRGKIVATLFAGVLGFVFLTAESCDSEAQSKVGQQRADKINNITLCGQPNQSTECKNLAEKLKRDNDPNKISYVYLFSRTGEPMGYFVAKGKVSSTQSQMGPMDFGVNACGFDSSYHDCYQMAEAPGDDGSYGPNEDGIFFFTANGNMIRWNDVYLQSDMPLDLPGARKLFD